MIMTMAICFVIQSRMTLAASRAVIRAIFSPTFSYHKQATVRPIHFYEMNYDAVQVRRTCHMLQCRYILNLKRAPLHLFLLMIREEISQLKRSRGA
jgi:hypothetical protein